jgi:hypothetical protein
MGIGSGMKWGNIIHRFFAWVKPGVFIPDLTSVFAHFLPSLYSI